MIYLLSGPINSGKTTALFNFIENKTNVIGFLCPYKSGLRVLYNIATQEYFSLEISESVDEVVQVGRFMFDKQGFDMMHEILESAVSTFEISWLIIDEVGRLELKGMGLEPALSAFLKLYKEANDALNLIMVVRDYLLEEVIIKYNLQDATILDKATLQRL